MFNKNTQQALNKVTQKVQQAPKALKIGNIKKITQEDTTKGQRHPSYKTCPKEITKARRPNTKEKPQNYVLNRRARTLPDKRSNKTGVFIINIVRNEGPHIADIRSGKRITEIIPKFTINVNSILHKCQRSHVLHRPPRGNLRKTIFTVSLKKAKTLSTLDMTNRKIHKGTDVNVAFTQEYYRVSNFHEEHEVD